MRSIRILLRSAVALVALATVATPALAQEQEEEQPSPARAPGEGEGPFERLIIRGATLIDGTGAPPRGPVDIVVEGNRIAEIEGVGTPGRPIEEEGRPQDATREIDAHGMYVLPGFVDLHVHAGGGDKNPAEYAYKLWLAHGVTTVRGVSLGGFEWSINEQQ